MPARPHHRAGPSARRAIALPATALTALLVGGVLAPVEAPTSPTDPAAAHLGPPGPDGTHPGTPAAARDGVPERQDEGVLDLLADRATTADDPAAPEWPGADEPAVAGLPDGDRRVSAEEPEASELPVTAESREGYLVLDGAATGGSGPERTFTVEVEPGLEADAAALASTVTEALLDEDASWARDHTLSRHADPETADIRIVLATPATVDERCGEAGLDTAGRHSCWDGERAMLNADRWRDGVEHVDDLDSYRRYLVNHEVGHGLGHGHVGCPGPGATAPVMMQQTLGLDGCEHNSLPYP